MNVYCIIATPPTRRFQPELLVSTCQVVSLSHLANVLGLDAVSAKAACETRGWVGDLDDKNKRSKTVCFGHGSLEVLFSWIDEYWSLILSM